MAAYEAVMAFVQNFAEDCYPIVVTVAGVVLQRLQATIGVVADSAETKSVYSDLQSQLCAQVQALLRNMTKDDALGYSEQVVGTLLRMIPTASDANNVLEDALMALSAVFTACEAESVRFLEPVKPVVISGLQRFEEHQVCYAAVGVVGDMCRAVLGAAAPYCREFMDNLLRALGEESLHRTVKPAIISCIGDVAICVGPPFVEFYDVVAEVVGSAAAYAQHIPDGRHDDYDFCEHINDMRIALVECWTGILNGLKGEGPVAGRESEEGLSLVNQAMQNHHSFPLHPPPLIFFFFVRFYFNSGHPADAADDPAHPELCRGGADRHAHARRRGRGLYQARARLLWRCLRCLWAGAGACAARRLCCQSQGLWCVMVAGVVVVVVELARHAAVAHLVSTCTSL